MELWVPIVEIEIAPGQKAWAADVPRNSTGRALVNYTAALPRRIEENPELVPTLLTSVCRISVRDEDAPRVTAACKPSDLDYALLRVCADIHAARDGIGFDGEQAKEIFREIAEHFTATGAERVAILASALLEVTLRGLPLANAQEIAAEHGLLGNPH